MALSNQHLFDKTYENNSSQLQQFIELAKGSIAAAQFDSYKNQYVGFDSHDLGSPENWFSCLNKIKELLLNLKQKTIQINFVDPLYTLVPKALFEEERLETYLKFNHAIDRPKDYDLLFDKVENLQLVIVYAVPKEIKNFFDQESILAKWHHFSKPLLEAASLRNTKEQLFQVHIQKNRFDALLVKGGKLQFFNSFNYETVDDFVYYLLYVMEQLKLDRESDSIELVGEFEEQSALYELLFKYIRHLKIGVRPKAVNFSTIFSKIPSHYYFNLFNQHLCE